MSKKPVTLIHYLGDNDMHWHPRMMWCVPGDAANTWQANLSGVPALAGHVPEDRMTVSSSPSTTGPTAPPPPPSTHATP
jgi:hypothetical protein